MTLSENLSKLATHAKEAEEHVAAAQEKASAQLQAERDAARAVGEQQAEDLHELAAEAEGKVSDRWNDVQRSWSEAMSKVRGDIESRKATLDLHEAESRAKWAEEDAGIAIDFADSAIVEAEYAALDAALARMEADELAVDAA
jgi:hypothetical protein